MAVASVDFEPKILRPRKIACGSVIQWKTAAALVVLLYFAGNQFAVEWTLFRSSNPNSVSGDFPHYYLAAKLAGMGGQRQFYYPAQNSKEAVLGKISSETEWSQFARQNGLSDTLHFSAPPIVATLLIPLGKLPIQEAYFVWRIFSEAAFFTGICLCLAICRSLTPVNLLVCTLAGFVFQPFTLTLEKGQFGALLLLLWAAGTLLAEKKYDVPSALMFALATVVKLTPVLAVGIFLVRRRWKWATAYALWMGLLIGIGIWQSGMENHRLYTAKMRSLSCGVPGPYSYCLPGIVQNAYYGNIFDYDHVPAETPRALCVFNKVMSGAFWLGTLFLLWKRNPRQDITFDLVVISLVTLLVAPFTWRHYYVLEILALMFVWLALKRGEFTRPKWVLWSVSICTLVVATRYPDYWQTHLSSGPLRVLLVALLPLSTLVLMGTLLFAWKTETHLLAWNNER